MSDGRTIIRAYSDAAGTLATAYESISSEELHAPAMIPEAGRHGIALDVGSGSGRDAAWLAGLGYDVVAVEPASGLRNEAERLHPSDAIRWLDDALPGLDRVHALAVAFDVVLLSAVWQHVAPQDRPRAFRKLATLLKPGGLLVLTLRNGPSPSDRPMHPTSGFEVEGLARAHGLEVLRIVETPDRQGRSDVTWSLVTLRMPDDGAGALPLVRGIVLSDDKSSTYKLALLRAIARIADQAPAAARGDPRGGDAVVVPLGLVALNWLRMYLPLVRAGLPQMPRNSGVERLAFAKEGFATLLERGVAATELRIGASFADELAVAVASAITRAAAVVAEMPANFTRYPNSDARVFEVVRSRSRERTSLVLDLATLQGWGELVVPGHLWRAMSRYGSWIEPMLVAEWSRMMRGYADRMGFVVAPGAGEAALAWSEPVRSTSLGRMAAQRLLDRYRAIRCVWTGRSLGAGTLDVDHCLPWSAWSCNDLWNLVPCHQRVNRHEKRERLPSTRALASARPRIEGWWQDAYLGDPALRARFDAEAAAALPLAGGTHPASVYEGVEWRRLRLSQEQQLAEWTPAGAPD